MANTAQTSALGHVAWEEESSFAESGDDTITVRHQIRDATVDVSGLQRPLVNRGGVFQRLNEADFDIPGAYGIGTFTVTIDAAGHGATAAGAISDTNLSLLLAHAVGNTDSTENGGVSAGSAGAGDEDTLVTDAGAEAWPVGGLVRVGARGDARGGGQGYATSTVTGSPATSTELLTGMPAGASDGDVVYGSLLVYPVSTVSTAGILTSDDSTNNNTLRFVLATANHVYVCRGCACTGLQLTGLTPGEIPQWVMEWSTVVWAPLASGFPSAVATADNYPAPSTTGSLFVQAKGATASATDIPRDFTLNIGQGMLPVTGQGGANTGQNITGWRRVPEKTTISFSIEAQAATASPTYWAYHSTDPNSIVAKHILYTTNTVDGRCLIIYAPNCKPMTSVPTQVDLDGLNYVTAEFECMTNTLPTNELTLSNWRLGMA